jgi:hypothetical protein
VPWSQVWASRQAPPLVAVLRGASIAAGCPPVRDPGRRSEVAAEAAEAAVAVVAEAVMAVMIWVTEYVVLFNDY